MVTNIFSNTAWDEKDHVWSYETQKIAVTWNIDLENCCQQKYSLFWPFPFLQGGHGQNATFHENFPKKIRRKECENGGEVPKLNLLLTIQIQGRKAKSKPNVAKNEPNEKRPSITCYTA